jgi:hypothetical protein
MTTNLLSGLAYFPPASTGSVIPEKTNLKNIAYGQTVTVPCLYGPVLIDECQCSELQYFKFHRFNMFREFLRQWRERGQLWQQ